MPWLLVDLALVLLALVLLAVFALRLWRGVKALGRDVGAAGEAVAAASEGLDRLTAELAERSAAGQGSAQRPGEEAAAVGAHRPANRPSPGRHR